MGTVSVVERARDAAGAGRWQEVKLLLVPALAEREADAWALLLLGEAYSRLDDPDPARAVAERALDAFRARDDRPGMMRAENLLGIILFDAGELDAAWVRFNAALALAGELGADRMFADVANNLGMVSDLQGERARAVECYQVALCSYRETGNVQGEAQTSHNLGISHREMERWEEAEHCFSRAAELARASGDARLQAFAMVARAELVLRRGDAATADRMVRAALLRFDVGTSVFGLAEVQKVRGAIARQRGELEEARAHLDRAVELGELHGVPLLDAEVRVERGTVLCLLGEAVAGADDLERAIGTFERLGASRRAERARALLVDPTLTNAKRGARRSAPLRVHPSPSLPGTEPYPPPSAPTPPVPLPSVSPASTSAALIPSVGLAAPSVAPPVSSRPFPTPPLASCALCSSCAMLVPPLE